MGFRNPVLTAVDPVDQVARDAAALAQQTADLARTEDVVGRVIETATTGPRVRIAQTAADGTFSTGVVEFIGEDGFGVPRLLAESTLASTYARLDNGAGGTFDVTYMEAAEGGRRNFAKVAADQLDLPADTRIGGKVNPADYFCQAYATATVSLTHNTWTALTMQAEDYDLGGFHALGSSRFIAPVRGIYEFSASAHFAASDVGRRGLRYVYMPEPGAAQVVPPSSVVEMVPGRGATAVSGRSVLFTLQPGGWVVAQALQDSGAALSTFVSADSATSATIRLVRAL